MSDDPLNMVRDLCVLLRQHESAETELLVRISELASRLDQLETEMADPYRGSRAELADRIQELWDAGWRPGL